MRLSSPAGQTGGQQGQRGLAIAVLTAAPVHAHADTARHVVQAHRGRVLVAMLASCAAAAGEGLVEIDASDGHGPGPGLGQHRHRDGAGVYPAALLGGWNALPAVAAGLLIKDLRAPATTPRETARSPLACSGVQCQRHSRWANRGVDGELFLNQKFCVSAALGGANLYQSSFHGCCPVSFLVIARIQRRPHRNARCRRSEHDQCRCPYAVGRSDDRTVRCSNVRSPGLSTGGGQRAAVTVRGQLSATGGRSCGGSRFAPVCDDRGRESIDICPVQRFMTHLL